MSTELTAAEPVEEPSHLCVPLRTPNASGQRHDKEKPSHPDQSRTRRAKYVNLCGLLMTPLFGWVYAIITVWVLVSGRGMSAVTNHHLSDDKIYTAIVFIAFYCASPLAVVITVIWPNDDDFGRYGSLGMMIVLLLWLAFMIWRYWTLREHWAFWDVRNHLAQFRIHAIRAKKPPPRQMSTLSTSLSALGRKLQGTNRENEARPILSLYESAGDLYDYVFYQHQHRWTLLLAMMASAGQATLIQLRVQDVPERHMAMSALCWGLMFFVFDSVTIGVIMRYDSLRVMLRRFDDLTNSMDFKRRERDEPSANDMSEISDEPPYLNISERLSITNLNRAEANTTLNLTISCPASLEGDSTASNVPPDNFEAWLRLREALVREISHPATLMATVFTPTCTMVLLGLVGSLVLLVVNVIDLSVFITTQAYYEMFACVSTSIFFFFILYVARKIEKLLVQQSHGISQLEFDIHKALVQDQTFGLGKWGPPPSPAKPESPNKDIELRSFYRLVQAANTYLQTIPARPVVLGLTLEGWKHMGLIIGLVVLNMLFIVASFGSHRRLGTPQC